MKESRPIRSKLHSRKVEFSRVKYFRTFVSSLNYVPPIGANTDKRRWSCDEGMDRELSNCVVNELYWSESTRDNREIERDLCHQRHGTMSCYLLSFLKAKTFFFYINWIPKIMVQFCYLSLYFGIDIVSRRLLQWIGRTENGLKLRPTTRYRTYNNQISTRLIQIIGTLRSDDADGDENVRKKKSLYKKNNNFARASRIFVHFFARFCTTTTWKCLISRFMENVNKQRRNFIPLWTWKWSLGIQLQEGSPTFDKVSG